MALNSRKGKITLKLGYDETAISDESMNTPASSILTHSSEVQSLADAFELHPPEQADIPEISAPEISEAGKKSQLGSLEAVYNINWRAGIAFLIIFNLMALLFISFFGTALFFSNGYFQLPPLPTLIMLLARLELIPFLVLSMGIVGMITDVRQRHKRLCLYTEGLLGERKPDAPIQEILWQHVIWTNATRAPEIIK